MNFYIGRFPGPKGGVTVKNKIICSSLKKHLKINIFDTERLHRSKINYFSFLLFLYENRGNQGYIGLSNNSLIRTLKILNYLPFIRLEDIKVLVMGGELPNILTNDMKTINLFKELKGIYVESKDMCDKMKKLGLTKTYYFPNCRPGSSYNRENKKGKCKLIYMSKVNKMKGVPLLFEIAAMLNEYNLHYTIDIFGQIDSDYKEEFYVNLKQYQNIEYKGVFNSTNSSKLYELLKEYDLHIFPSIYENEGYPGIIIETKIVGVPTIANEWRYANELIQDNVDGWIVKNITANDVIEILNSYDIKSQFYTDKCIENSKRFILESYIKDLLEGMI